tara:strand:- start:146 stop:358 length:213 start_codon:yes stop_codon:yes gene_type:complete
MIPCLFFKFTENFSVERKREGNKIQMGFLNNTPEPIKNLMTSLNEIGGQMTADSQYDTVDTNYLDKDKIK